MIICTLYHIFTLQQNGKEKKIKNVLLSTSSVLLLSSLIRLYYGNIYLKTKNLHTPTDSLRYYTTQIHCLYSHTPQWAIISGCNLKYKIIHLKKKMRHGAHLMWTRTMKELPQYSRSFWSLTIMVRFQYLNANS